MNRLINTEILPVDIVLSPEWWFHNEKIETIFKTVEELREENRV